jgi:FlgD Ig-like domain/Matrixin
MKSNRFRIAVAALAVVAVALSLASPASAFIRLTSQAASGSGVVQAHWYDSELPLLSVVNPANADIPFATALAVVQASAQAWEDVNTSYFTVNPVDWTTGSYLPPALALDGQNSVFFDVAGANFGPGSGVIAFVRSYVNLVDGHTLDADLVFNDKEFYQSLSSPAVTPSPDPAQISVDLQAVITHEYGHYFSLGHTGIATATMIPYIQNDTSQRTLELDDRAGLSTVYPESASRPGGVTPGGVDFAATTGTISGTCVSGYTGAATFGAHVEAINLADPSPDASISAISGELTVRNGQGDWMIHGLPPGTYVVAIVPTDGVHTILADENLGGIFNGLDINFEPEFWNAAGEGGCGYTDTPNSYVPISVSSGANSGGINFVTNTYPGLMEMAQYGQFENYVTDRSNAYRAVRFDPPFDPPYTIRNISFPTFTFTGGPGTFTSVQLVPMTAAGTPDLSAPIFIQAPFVCSPNGINEVPINLTVTAPGQTFFWVMRWAARPAPPYPNHPFIRMDFASMERGFFANSYQTNSLTGPWSLLIDRNLAVSMRCQIGAGNCSISATAGVPIEGARSLGANRRATKTEFNFVRPTDTRADGFPMPMNSLERTDLLARPPFGPWSPMASGGAGAGSISMNTVPSGVLVWAAQAVDKNGHKAILSNNTITGLNEDADEPNGRLNEATPITTPAVGQATYAPAGDQDYYGFMAKPGDVIEANAVAIGQDGFNNLDLTMFLFDNSGDIVAFDDDSNGNLNPRLSYTVPPPSANSKSKAPRKFTILMTDFRGSLFSPTSAPRLILPETYQFSVNVTPSLALAGRLARGMDPNGFGFALGGPNPANPHAKLLYVLPRSADGARVSLRVYDIQGRLVRTLVDRNDQAGPHTVIWDGTDQSGRHVSSGTYFARITAGSFRAEEKVLFVK